MLCGITPAYAGKSKLSPNCIVVKRDHPRICGEKSQHIGARYIPKGSPPHMRGKVNEKKANGFDIRITPAYAGKSTLLCFPAEPGWDHPRICGEKPHSVLVDPVCVGSPPHMRGKGRATTARVAHTGITPAYAGKSLLYHFFRDFARDHPRICGEKCRIIYVLVSKPGSPPHMRGKVCVASELARYSGITPAYAGKRLKRSRSTVPPVAIVPLFPSVCNKPVVSDGSPAGRDAPLFLPAENAVPASPAYNLRSL